MRPSFTGSLGSSHITTSASTSLEASFPQFELRMTSQTTTAVERQQKNLVREIIWKENPPAKFRPQIPLKEFFQHLIHVFSPCLYKCFACNPDTCFSRISFASEKNVFLLKRRNLLQDLSARQSDLDPRVP